MPIRRILVPTVPRVTTPDVRTPTQTVVPFRALQMLYLFQTTLAGPFRSVHWSPSSQLSSVSHVRFNDDVPIHVGTAGQPIHDYLHGQRLVVTFPSPQGRAGALVTFALEGSPDARPDLANLMLS